MCPGIGIGISPVFQKPIDWARYWANSGLFLFFGQYKNISGGRLNNEVTGSTDWLTVAGVAGSETYQCPNTAAYIAADTDYIWFKTDTTQRTTTTAELIGYDLPRTPIKYDNTAPHQIRWIGILKDTTVLTSVQLNNLYSSFNLSIWWSGIWNGYGYIKENRAGQQLWTPEAVYEAESVALFALFTTPPTDARKTNIDNLIKYYKGANPTVTNVWAKLDVFVNLRAADSQAATRNWIKNDHHASLIGSPVFTADVGITVASGKYIKSDFIPSTVGVNFIQDSASQGCKLSGYDNTGSSVRVLMGNNGFAPAYDALIGQVATALDRLNCSTAYSGQVPVNGINIVTRTAVNVNATYREGVKFTSNTASTGLCNHELYVGCSNANGTPNYYSIGTYEFYFMGGGLTDADELVIRQGYAAYITGL